MAFGAEVEAGWAALRGLGMPVPDSSIARRAGELIAEVEPAYLVNHSIRAYAWAVELALHDDLEFDPEILFVSSALHDIGLIAAYDIGGCFETDGAIAAERFSLEQGQSSARARAIHDAIDLHMSDPAPGQANEANLLSQSTGTDVTGWRIEDVRPASIPVVLAAYPRLTFKRDFAAAFVDQATRKPTCTVAAMVKTGKLDAIARAPFES
jgi:HD domain-containing protein